MHRLWIIAAAVVLVTSPGGASAQPGASAPALPMLGAHYSGARHVRLRGRARTRVRGRLRLRMPKKVGQLLHTAKQRGSSLLSSLGHLVGGTHTPIKRVRLRVAKLMRRQHANPLKTSRRRLRGLSVRTKVQAEVPGLLPSSGRTLRPLDGSGLLSVMPGGLARLERAVEAMHMAGIAHGNITVANLRVDEFGQLYLVGGWKGARSEASPAELAADKIGLAGVQGAFSGR